MEARLGYSIVYAFIKKKTPVIVEFDIDVEAKEPSKSSETLFVSSFSFDPSL